MLLPKAQGDPKPRVELGVSSAASCKRGLGRLSLTLGDLFMLLYSHTAMKSSLFFFLTFLVIVFSNSLVMAQVYTEPPPLYKNIELRQQLEAKKIREQIEQEAKEKQIAEQQAKEQAARVAEEKRLARERARKQVIQKAKEKQIAEQQAREQAVRDVEEKRLAEQSKNLKKVITPAAEEGAKGVISGTFFALLGGIGLLIWFGRKKHFTEPTKPTPIEPVIENDLINFFSKLINGNFSLAKSFWVYGVLVLFLLNIIFNVVISNFGVSVEVIIGFMLVSTIYEITVIVGVWCASNKYQGQRLWAILAKIVMVLWGIMLPLMWLVVVGLMKNL